jgi:hypothetical protein
MTTQNEDEEESEGKDVLRFGIEIILSESDASDRTLFPIPRLDEFDINGQRNENVSSFGESTNWEGTGLPEERPIPKWKNNLPT